MNKESKELAASFGELSEAMANRLRDAGGNPSDDEIKTLATIAQAQRAMATILIASGDPTDKESIAIVGAAKSCNSIMLEAEKRGLEFGVSPGSWMAEVCDVESSIIKINRQPSADD